MIDYFSRVISQFANTSNSHVFGQNLFKPSYISGLGKYMVCEDGVTPSSDLFFDSPNVELASVGYGIGRSLSGVNTLLIVKQQDFLYLAIDQLVNSTINIQDSFSLLGSFNIICLISDIPCEGTQAFSNNLSLFNSIAPSLSIFYHYFPCSLSYQLNNLHPFALHFCSVEHIYRTSFAKDIIVHCPHYVTDSSEFDKGITAGNPSSSIWHIVLGFVPNSQLNYSLDEFYLFPVDLSFSSICHMLSSNSFSKHTSLFLHHSDSGSHDLVYSLHSQLAKFYSTSNIHIISSRSFTNTSFSLISQG